MKHRLIAQTSKTPAIHFIQKIGKCNEASIVDNPRISFSIWYTVGQHNVSVRYRALAILSLKIRIAVKLPFSRPGIHLYCIKFNLTLLHLVPRFAHETKVSQQVESGSISILTSLESYMWIQCVHSAEGAHFSFHVETSLFLNYLHVSL